MNTQWYQVTRTETKKGLRFASDVVTRQQVIDVAGEISVNNIERTMQADPEILQARTGVTKDVEFVLAQIADVVQTWTPKTRREYQRTQRGPSSAQGDLFDAQCNLFE